MNSAFRVRILCEDRRSERFLRGICAQHGLRVLSVDVAPFARGAASDWVLGRYADLVQRRRSKNFQQNLGLLVQVDGDSQGVQARKLALDARLSALQLPVRAADEPVAIVVPTWCIETWLLHLGDLAHPSESVKLKRDGDPAFRAALQRLDEDEARFVRLAVEKWKAFAPAPLSLVDARVEVRRVGIP